MTETPTSYYARASTWPRTAWGCGAGRPSGQYVQAPNDERGISSVVRPLRKKDVALTVLEATGGSSSLSPRISLWPGC